MRKFLNRFIFGGVQDIWGVIVGLICDVGLVLFDKNKKKTDQTVTERREKGKFF